MLRAEPAATLASDTRTRGGWQEMVVATVGLLVLLTGYSAIVRGGDWIVSVGLVALLVATATVVLHLLGLRRSVTPLALLVELVVLAWVFVPSTVLVVLPTFSTFSALSDLVSAAGPVIVEEQAPVPASAPIVLVLAASFGALVVLIDLVLQLRRGVLWVGALLLAVFVMPALITGTTPSPWIFVLAAATWLVLLRGRTSVNGATGTARQGPAMALGIGGLAAALLFPVVSPDISAVATSWGKPPPQVFGRGINPMVELGSNLRRNNPVEVLSFTTDLDEVPYLKVATLPDFTGKTWRPADDYDSTRFEGQMSVSDDISAEPRKTAITINQLRSDLLPVPYPTTDVSGIKGSYRLERTGQTIRTRDNDSRGQTYTATSLDVQPTAEQLRASDATGPNLAPDFRRYLRLDDPPPVIGSTARRVTDGQTTNYDKALALQDYFRGGAFEYSETAPVANDYDGNGLGVIEEFLARKSGYCVHFSSAMAVMARTLDIPARVAVGYAPGARSDFVDGERTYRVMSDDLHAWTELYFAGVGWVRFDPTPGIGDRTAFVEPVDDQAAPDAAETTPDEQVNPRGEQPRVDENTGATAEEATAGPTAVRSAAAVLVGMLALVLAPLALRRLRRQWRWRGAARSPDPAWREVEDTARDLGVVTSPTDTPRGFAHRLSGAPGLDRDALHRLLERVERARFSRDGSPDGSAVEDARLVASSVVGGASRRQRWRAALLPRSLGPRPSEAIPEPAPAT